MHLLIKICIAELLQGAAASFRIEKNKENSYKWQMKLEKCKGEFASKLLYKVVNEELEERIPRLPKYISDGLDWIEKKLGGR